MQQYYSLEERGRVLTVFHTEDSVSFDMEHYGGFQVSDTELLDFLETGREDEQFEVTSDNQSGRGDASRNGTLRLDMGGLEVCIDGRDEEKVIRLTADQVETLQDSITVGSVERYEDGQYPVESVGRDGVRDRAEHN